MKEPFFTVVIPTHKRPETLTQALASVTAQSHQGSQIIVVDDADDAETRAVVLDFPNVEYVVNHQARGGSAARNLGVANARGRWIAFLDDDDIWLPQKLEAVHGLITSSTADPGLIYSGAEHFDDETGMTTRVTQPRLRGRVLDDVLYRNSIGGMSVVVVRRDLLDQVGGLDPRFPAMQDMELFVRVAQLASFDFLAEPLVRVRVSARARISADHSKKLVAARLFAEKYAHLMTGKRRLRHRTASRTLLYALRAGDTSEVLRNLPWTLAGIFVDPGNMPYVIRGVLRHLRGPIASRAIGAGAPP